MIFLILAALFWFAETWYFGWNLTAQSDAERTCDSIVVGLLAAWVASTVISWAKRIERKIDTLNHKPAGE